MDLMPKDNCDNDVLAKLYKEHGYSLYKMGEYTQALSDLTNAINLGSNKADKIVYYFYRSLVYQALGEYEKKEEDLAKAKSLDV